MNWTKPLFYSTPVSIERADNVGPLFKSILDSAELNYRNMVTIQNIINHMIKTPSNNKKWLEKLGSFCDQFYSHLAKINGNVDEVHELYGDFTDIKTGVISCLGKRGSTPVFISILRGETNFTMWRGINEKVSANKLIENREDFV